MTLSTAMTRESEKLDLLHREMRAGFTEIRLSLADLSGSLQQTNEDLQQVKEIQWQTNKNLVQVQDELQQTKGGLLQVQDELQQTNGGLLQVQDELRHACGYLSSQLMSLDKRMTSGFVGITSLLNQIEFDLGNLKGEFYRLAATVNSGLASCEQRLTEHDNKIDRISHHLFELTVRVNELRNRAAGNSDSDQGQLDSNDNGGNGDGGL